MRLTVNSALLVTLFLFVFGAIGCGGASDRPPLGQVTGTVTVNGEPLAGVLVSFKPEVGRAAVGMSDANGFYRLQYVYGVNGAKVGQNTVSFSWPTGASGTVPIPDNYGAKSTLQEEVSSGSNKFDFDLEIDPTTAAKMKRPIPD